MAATTLTPITGTDTSLAHRHLISDELWDRLVGRIVKDEGIDRSLTERIVDQTLAFLVLCGKEPEGSYSPSPLVDIGWHTFILYTKAYADFCQKTAGRFIHHHPSDLPGVDYGTGNVGRTVIALRSHGISVDELLWANKGTSCSSYCSGDSCAGGGGDGDSGCSHGG